MAKIAGKVWGLTTEFFRSQITSVHHLRIQKGGYCSVHKHQLKTNIFYIISGQLEIVQEVGGQMDTTILGPGQSMEITPGIYHKFEALQNTECIEVYQVSLIEPDIQRRTEGGKN